jgi:hypothetical protein
MASNRVASAAYRGSESVLAAESNRGDDVGHTRAASDERRLTLDVAIPDLAHAIVGRIVRLDQLALEVRRQAIDSRLVD